MSRMLYVGAIVGVLGMMGYGVYEAFAGADTGTHAVLDGRRSAAVYGAEADGGFPGRGPGQGQGAGYASGQTGGWGRTLAAVPAEPYQDGEPTWTELSGTVVSLDGSELVLQTEPGVQLVAGLGKPSYWENQGIPLQPGDEVELTGFWEDGEFEVSSVTLAGTGQTVVLRDEAGRPMWAGGGRWVAPASVDAGQAF
jgi:hypothetical protein